MTTTTRLGLTAGLVWLAFTLAWFRFWVLMEHPWPLYAGMALALGIGLTAALRRGRLWGRVIGGIAAILSVVLVAMLLTQTRYDAARPRGPAVGSAFPVDALASLSDARDGARVRLPSDPGTFAFVVLFRGFW